MSTIKDLFKKGTNANSVSIACWTSNLTIEITMMTMAQNSIEITQEEVLQHHEVLDDVHEMWADTLDERPHPVKEGSNIIDLIINP